MQSRIGKWGYEAAHELAVDVELAEFTDMPGYDAAVFGASPQSVAAAFAEAGRNGVDGIKVVPPEPEEGAPVSVQDDISVRTHTVPLKLYRQRGRLFLYGARDFPDGVLSLMAGRITRAPKVEMPGQAEVSGRAAFGDDAVAAERAAKAIVCRNIYNGEMYEAATLARMVSQLNYPFNVSPYSFEVTGVSCLLDLGLEGSVGLEGIDLSRIEVLEVEDER